MRPSSLLPVLLAAALACGGALASGGSGGGGGSSGSGSSTEMPGEILVKLRTTGALQPLLARYPLTLVSRFGARPIYRLRVVGSARVKDLLPSLALEPDVLIAENNPTSSSPEARKNVAWAIGTASAFVAQWAPQAIRLGDAQKLSTGAGIRVAVLDTGIDRNHPLFAGRLLPGYDFVDDDADPSEGGSTANAGFGHGTHVAGLIAMAAPGAQIMPIRVLDPDGGGNAWVLAEGLLRAIDPDGDPSTDDGAHVINLSLGSLQRTRIIDTIADIAACAPTSNDPIGDRSDPGYDDDVRRCANSGGALVIAAAGNDASSSVKEYPAAEGDHGLMAVAASNSGGKLASFSNYGSWVHLAAPGDGITSAFPGGGYATWSGTSMAAPLAAGTAALVRAADASLRPRDVVDRMQRRSAMLCDRQSIQLDAAAAVADTVPPPVACR